MGIEAEIYDKENNQILTGLKDDIICPICCAVLQDPMLLDCCSGHICSPCLSDVRKSSFKNCPLCRKAKYNAIKSRFMMSFCSKIKLVCPVDGCNTAVPYLEFDEHKKRCLELSMQKMTQISHAEISARNEMLTRELEESKKKVEEQKKQISSLEAKICCKDEKIVLMEKMYNDQKDLLKIIRKDHKELSDKKLELEERYSEVKKKNFEYEKEAKTRNEAEISARNKSLTKELEELKMKIRNDESRRKDQKKQTAIQLHDCKILKEEKEKYKKLLEQKIRENFKLQQNHSHCKEQA